MASSLVEAGYAVITGGTDTHLALIDLSPKGVKGNAAEKALGRAYITCNKNGIPFDTEKFTTTSGIRVGSPAGTTRGFGTAEFREIGMLMAEVLDALAENPKGNPEVEASVRERVKALTARFPIYAG
jgi:glycine hydroxymethyltransferase